MKMLKVQYRKNSYMDVYLDDEDYVNYFELMPKRKRMGLVDFTWISDKRIIANLIGQYHYLPRGQQHTDYESLTTGFKFIKNQINGPIAMPKIGCGLGGGDWNIVRKIIEEVFDDRDVYIYEL